MEVSTWLQRENIQLEEKLNGAEGLLYPGCVAQNFTVVFTATLNIHELRAKLATSPYGKCRRMRYLLVLISVSQAEIAEKALQADIPCYLLSWVSIQDP